MLWCESTQEAMGSMDAEVEIDMEISDDEQEVVDGRGVKRSAPVDKSDSSRKRKRSSSAESSPSVRVEYRNLSRESRKKLQEVLRDWSLWQGYHSRHNFSEVKDHVESGEEQYYPAMQVGPVGNSFSVTFWVDKPAKQARSKEGGDIRGISRTSSEDLRVNEADVPLYDRVTPSLSSSESSKDGVVELEREAVRCFNCGSYSHALRECKRQWNHEAINSARSNHAAKRSFSSGPRSAARYYETPHSNENQEPADRSPWQLSQTSEHGLSPSNSLFRNTPGFLKKPEKSNRPTSNEENEEGEILDGVATPGEEEELFIAFSPDPPSADKLTPDSTSSGVRVPYSSPPERMWRSPASAYSPSPPSHLHPVYHHQRSFGYSPPNHVYPHTTPPLAHYNGVHAQRAWDERQPQLPWDVERQPQSRAWEERSQPHRSPWEDSRIPYHPDTSVGPAPVSVPSAPIPIPTAKKEDDEWELNFESSVHQLESNSSISHTAVPDHYSTPTPSPGLTINTASLGFSAPDPSQLSPTGSGYGDSFRPSPAPQPPVQYRFSYHTTPGREPTCYSTEAWEKAQAALSSLQSDGAQGGTGS